MGDCIIEVLIVIDHILRLVPIYPLGQHIEPAELAYLAYIS